MNIETSIAITQSVERKYNILEKSLDERGRRIWAAAEADEIGYGGLSIVYRATGLAMSTIRQGSSDIIEEKRNVSDEPRRIRRAGGGRKKVAEKDNITEFKL